MDFGSRVRELRVGKDLSQRDFADRIQMDFTYLSKIENGKVEPPSEEKIRRMARELDADPEELLALAGKWSIDGFRKAVEANPEVAEVLRRIQTRKLSNDQISDMVNIATRKTR